MADEISNKDLMQAILGVNDKVNAQIGELREEMDRRFEDLENKMDIRFQEVDMRFNVVESKLDQVSVTRMNIMENEIGLMKRRMESVEKIIGELQTAE